VRVLWTTVGKVRYRTVAEELVASQSGAYCDSEREPLQLEGSGADNEDGRGNVYASDVLRCQWACGLSSMGRHFVCLLCGRYAWNRSFGLWEDDFLGAVHTTTRWSSGRVGMVLVDVNVGTRSCLQVELATRSLAPLSCVQGSLSPNPHHRPCSSSSPPAFPIATRLRTRQHYPSPPCLACTLSTLARYWEYRGDQHYRY
jgi:hypothetical protein